MLQLAAGLRTTAPSLPPPTFTARPADRLQNEGLDKYRAAGVVPPAHPSTPQHIGSGLARRARRRRTPAQVPVRVPALFLASGSGGGRLGSYTLLP